MGTLPGSLPWLLRIRRDEICQIESAYRHERWIDRACHYGIPRNEAMLVEDMVAKRMARLAELKGERK
jgi:hypothetical protein